MQKTHSNSTANNLSRREYFNTCVNYSAETNENKVRILYNNHSMCRETKQSTIKACVESLTNAADIHNELLRASLEGITRIELTPSFAATLPSVMEESALDTEISLSAVGF